MTLRTNEIHLFRSPERAEAHSKKLAQRCVCLGHTCTTPVQFVLDLAQLVNSNAQIINDLRRLAHLISVVSSTEDLDAYEYFSKPKNLMFLIQFIKQSSGTDQFLKALNYVNKEKGKFSFLEEKALIIADEYKNVINAFDFEELGVIARKIAVEFKDCFNVTYEDVCLCQSEIDDCIESVAKNSNEPSFKSIDGENKVVNVKSAFATLSELRAKKSLYVDVLNGISDEQSVAIVTNDVQDDAHAIQKLVAQMGIDARIEYEKSLRFLNTNFGQAIYACDAIIRGEESSLGLKYSDFLHNPLSGVSLYKCLELEKTLRENSSISNKKVAEEIKKASPTFDLFMTLVNDSFTTDKTPILNEIENFIKNDNLLGDERKSENVAALHAFKEISEMFCLVGFDDELDYSILNCIEVSSHCVTGSITASKRINIINSKMLDKLPAGAFDKVVFSDVSSKTINASTKFDALYSIMHKIGVDERLTSSEIARMNFYSGINASKNEVLFCLPLRNLRNNEELFSSFVIQEYFLNQYGELLDIENLSKQCSRLGIKHSTYGEENIPLTCNSLLDFSDESISRNICQLDYKLNSCCDIDKYLSSTDEDKIVLTPSEIETYCQCPHKWFFERRVSPKSLDYEFNQIERGNIVHLTFKTFYDELYKQGIFRLYGEEDAISHKDLFEECYDKSVKEFVHSKDLDDDEISKVEDWLSNFDIMQTFTDCTVCLQVQSIFPKKYIVAESEMRIKPEQNVNYAGVVINGTLDRLDVSPETNSFIVVDYKGNIKDHGCGKDCFDMTMKDIENPPLPSKIQTLIYASCMQKLTNKKCDAAVYLSYNKLGPGKPPVVGAIEYEEIEGFEKLLGDPGDSAIFMDMSEYLQRTENRVKERLDALLNGDIYPKPSSKRSCEFCACVDCPMRGNVKHV